MNSTVRNIIFDLGDVLLPLEWERMGAAFAALGLHDFKRLYNGYQGVAFMEDFETGHLTENEFVGYLLAHCRTGTPATQALAAWNSLLGQFNPATINLVQQLGGRYRLFLYSNTNSIHYRLYQEDFAALTGLHGLEALFEKAYFSHLYGHRKPHAAGFEHILMENGLTAAETLFIDDGEIHLATARQLGMQVWQAKSEAQVLAFLKELLTGSN